MIGGPGLFVGCDKNHDQNWSNYIVPIQIAAMDNLYNSPANEVVHWVVYEPPYRYRWDDDSVITKDEKKQDDGYNLHSIRKNAADKMLKKGATSYLDRIKQIATENKITYKGISDPAQFWKYLKTFKDNSFQECGIAVMQEKGA